MPSPVLLQLHEGCRAGGLRGSGENLVMVERRCVNDVRYGPWWTAGHA